MSKRIEMIFLVIMIVISFVSSILTIVGFLYNSESLIIESSKWLSFSVLLLLTKLGEMIYRDSSFGTTKEVEVTIKSKEDIEAFRKQILKEIELLLEQAEEEELNKGKNE